MRRNLLIGTSLVAAFASTSVEARSAAVMTNDALEANTQLASAIHIVTEGHKKLNATGMQALKAGESSACVKAYNTLAAKVTHGEGEKATLVDILDELVKNPASLNSVSEFRKEVEAEFAAEKGEKVVPAPEPVVGVDLSGLTATVEGERTIAENLLAGKIKLLEAAEKKVTELKATEDAFTNAQADLKEKETNLKEAEDRLTALKEQTVKDGPSDDKLKAQIRSAESNVKTAKESLEEAKKTLEAATKAWNAVQGEKATAEADLEAAKKAKVDEEINLEDLGKSREEKAVAAASRALKAAEAKVNKINSADKAFKKAQDALKKAEDSFNKAKENLAGKGHPKAAEKALEEAKKTLEAATKAWNAVQGEKATAEADLKAAKEAKAAAEKKLADSKLSPEEKKVNKLKAEIERLKQTAAPVIVANAATLNSQIKEAPQAPAASENAAPEATEVVVNAAPEAPEVVVNAAPVAGVVNAAPQAPEVEEDAAPEATEVEEDTTPEVEEDAATEVEEDTTPEVEEDAAPEVEEDAAPEVEEDAASEATGVGEGAVTDEEVEEDADSQASEEELINNRREIAWASVSMSNLAAAVDRSEKQLEKYKASSNEADRKAVVDSVIECMTTINSLEDSIKVLSGKTSVHGLEVELNEFRNKVLEVDRLLIAHQDAIEKETLQQEASAVSGAQVENGNSPQHVSAGLTQGGRDDGYDIAADLASGAAAIAADIERQAKDLDGI